MEKGGEERPAGGIIPIFEAEFPISPNLGILDLMDHETNMNQFIDLMIQEESANFTSQVFDFDHNHQMMMTDAGGCLVDHNQQLFPLEQDQLFKYFNGDVSVNPAGGGISRDCSTENEFANDVVEEEFELEEEESCATTSQKKSNKMDRSRTLISERRRRSRMKEKLYVLRSLVPNITKMDKASIIGDAVLYVQDLQLQAKKLKSEIAGLESSFKRGHHNNNNKLKSKKMIGKSSSCPPNPATINKISKMDVFEVEEGEFYVRLVSNKGRGVAVILYKALHSLSTTNFIVKTSNLVSDHATQNYVFTFTLHRVREDQEDMDLAGVKMRIARAFSGEGFDFETLIPSA